MKQFQTSDGLSLSYWDEGAGVPLICLAGLSRSSGDFDPVVAGFSNRLRVIRLDYRGRGESDHDTDFMNYAPPVEVRDTLELMDHLDLPRAALLGTSRGGLIAMGLASVVKDRLLGVVFNDIGPEIAQEGIDAIMDYLGVQPPEGATLDKMARAKMHLTAETFPNVSLETWRTFLSHGFRETPQGLSLNYDPKLRDAVLAQAETSLNPDLWPFFDALAGVPLALLRGENSDILSHKTAAEMQRRRPDMIFSEVKDRGHIPFLDEPECQDVLSRFVEVIRDA